MTAFLHQYYTESDLQQFYTDYFPELEGVAIAEVKTPSMWQPKYEYEMLVIDDVIVAHIMNPSCTPIVYHIRIPSNHFECHYHNHS